MAVARGHLKVIGAGGAALIAFIFFVGWGISRQVTGPLQALKDAVLRVKSLDYAAAHVNVTSDDEIGVLGRTFNEMARTLGTKSAALHAYKNQLEQRIADRTAELRVANAALQAEIEERKLSAQRNEYLAYYDSLTDLPNRAMFSRLLRAGIDTALVQDTQLALLFVDLDRFKNINDTLGHATGDQLLQEMAHRLKACLRADDAVARLGGDEFVVMLQHIAQPAEVEAVARKILAAASKPFGALGQEFHVTASVGVSLYPRDGSDERSLMKNADIAMYHAKDEGKNNFQLYSAQLDNHTFERLTMESALRQAMARQEFELFYQPKIDVAGGRMSGMEALLRWRHPEFGLIPPAKFIPLAEETGLILPIGKWVLRTACAQNVKWNIGAPRPLCIAVNLSARQFGEEGLLGDVVAALQETGMDPSLLELEITESMLMRDIDKAIGVLTALKNMGVRIAMDDFGTGYSSLSNLKKFPLDTIKVDRSFVRDLPGCFEDRGIAEAIFATGRALSLTVVAEGVETEAQADFLRLHACDKFQGYLFSHPLSSGEFGELLGKQMQDEAA
jgi:diguanylate cyclase (GGDEF)-like protein